MSGLRIRLTRGVTKSTEQIPKTEEMKTLHKVVRKDGRTGSEANTQEISVDATNK